MANVGSNLDHECDVSALEEFYSSPDGVGWRPRANPAEQAQRVDPVVQSRIGDRRSDSSNAKILQPRDDAAQTQVCSIRHNRSPTCVVIIGKLTYHLRVCPD